MENDLIGGVLMSALPCNANQGALLITKDIIGNPPFTSNQLEWLDMQDIIGVANVKLEYDEKQNKYKLYKAKGHRDNLGNWNYQWEELGEWETLTEETAEILRNLTYLIYRYEATANTLKVYGVKKDMSEDLLCSINFVSPQNLQDGLNILQNAINNETTRATNKENQLDEKISIEIDRATDEELRIDSDIDNEITRAEAEEQRLDNKIEEETTRATHQEQDLQRQIDDNKENLSNYIGNFATKALLDVYSGTLTNNDYAIVEADETHNNECWRYIYNATQQEWLAQYKVNNTPLTQSQLEAINSGINTTKVGQIETNRQAIANLNREIGDLQGELIPGNGIDITFDIISVKNGNGVIVDNTGVKAKGNANAGIDVNANGISVKINTTNLKFNGGNIDTVLQIWNGTQAEYDLIAEKDSNTLYLINEEV